MSNREMDELLYNLRKRMDKGFENKELTILLSNDSISKLIKREFSLESDRIVNELIEKIATDFYAYYLYKLELEEDINQDIARILLDFDDFTNEEDVINYVKTSSKNFNIIIDGYFEYHKQSIEYQCAVMANVVNKRKGLEFSGLYKNFFCVDFDYNHLLLPHNAIVGLELLDVYNTSSHNDDKIINFINVEYENKMERYNFLNYILSNVYANLKLNGCDNQEDENIVKLTEKMDKRMRCFYDDNDYVINLVKKYNDIYGKRKWFDFKDIRDYFPFEKIDLIYKLDSTYKHPFDVIKNASEVYTIMENIQTFLYNSVETFAENGLLDDEIINWISGLLAGEVTTYYEKNDIFNSKDDELFRNLLKLYLVSIFYEFTNYTIDNLTDDEVELYEYIDNGVSSSDTIELFSNESDRELIINKFIEYYFSEEKIETLARKQMIKDKKFNKLLDINPFMYLEYRKAFGTLLPLETSKSTEYGNLILGTIFEIVNLTDELQDEHGIMYEDIAQMFKNNIKDIYLPVDEIIGFILSNIYENLVNKQNPSDDERDYIEYLESDNFDILSIVDNEQLLGELIFYFFNLNCEYLSDDKMRKLRQNTYEHNKVKVIKKLDPFYEEDEAILK